MGRGIDWIVGISFFYVFVGREILIKVGVYTLVFIVGFFLFFGVRYFYLFSLVFVSFVCLVVLFSFWSELVIYIGLWASFRCLDEEVDVYGFDLFMVKS